MFGDSGRKKNKEENSSGMMQKSHRGNMDEYEALRTIVSENPGLLMRVLDEIRSARNQDANQKSSKKASAQDDKSKKDK